MEPQHVHTVMYIIPFRQTRRDYYCFISLAVYLVHIPLIYAMVMLSLSGVRKSGLKNSKGSVLFRRKKVKKKEDDISFVSVTDQSTCTYKLEILPLSLATWCLFCLLNGFGFGYLIACWLWEKDKIRALIVNSPQGFSVTIYNKSKN